LRPVGFPKAAAVLRKSLGAEDLGSVGRFYRTTATVKDLSG
jgi:hypothetical protein